MSASLLFALISYKLVLLVLSGLPDSSFLEGWAARSNLGKTWASWLQFCHEEDVAESGLRYNTGPCSLDAGLVRSVRSKGEEGDFRGVKQVRKHSLNLAHGRGRQSLGSNWLEIIQVGSRPAS